MSFTEIGSFLKSEREKKGLSLDKVASELKINPRILAAIEGGEGAHIPPAYTRGFIRTYAAFLGLSSEEINELLNNPSQIQEARSNAASAVASPEIELPAPKRKSRGLLGAICVMAILSLGAYGYWAWRNGYLEKIFPEERARINSIEQLPEADAWRPQASISTPPAPEKAETAPDVSAPQAAHTPDAPATSEPAPEKAAAEAHSGSQPSAQGAEEDKVETSSHHKLIITATEECWVHSRADKTDTRQFSLRKGDTFALTFARDLELKLGNAGGVVLRYDGKELPPAGTSGQVKTLAFPPKND